MMQLYALVGKFIHNQLTQENKTYHKYSSRQFRILRITHKSTLSLSLSLSLTHTHTRARALAHAQTF